MKLLALGDVVSHYGCSFLHSQLPKLKREFNIDVCIVNGENSAEGNGITPSSANYLFSVGADIITTGNHCFRRKESYSYYDENKFVLRPYNYGSSVPGKGVEIYDFGSFNIGVVNLLGTMFMDNFDNPFKAVDAALKELEGVKIIIVDFHAEAGSEKLAMGYYLDGRVSAVFGTHTHIQTADERILPSGTGYISDLGMCGAEDAVLGVKKEIIIQKFLTNMPCRFETETNGRRIINGCCFQIDEKSGECENIQRICIKS